MVKHEMRHSYYAPCSTSRLGRRVKRSSWSTAPLAIVLIWLGSSTSTIRGLAGAVIHSNAFSGLPLPLPTPPKRSKPCDLRGKDVFCIVRTPATSVPRVLQVHSIDLSSAPDAASLHSMPFILHIGGMICTPKTVQCVLSREQGQRNHVFQSVFLFSFFNP